MLLFVIILKPAYAAGARNVGGKLLHCLMRRIGDGIQLKAAFRHESTTGKLLEHFYHRVVRAQRVQKHDGAVVAAELLEREYLKKLLKRADAAGQDDAGVGIFLHQLLALAHGLGEYHAAAPVVQDAGLVEKPRRYADDSAARAVHAVRTCSHESLRSAAEHDRVASAAYQLALKGHDVTIKEGSPEAGGMMRYGIPKYRLPRRVLDQEIARILDLGVKLELNTTVKDIEEEKNTNGYDAVFLAVGAGMAKNAYIPGGDAKHMLDAVSVLRSMEGEEEPLLGRKVVVYGGGNTAIDVARSAKRMGAEPLIIYRRTREKMPAHDFEVEEALQEGVSVKWLSTITEAENPKEIRIEKMKLDENGNPQPTGEFETVEADTVVLALGQNVDQSLIEKIPGLDIEKGVVKVDRFMRTGVPGIYAGGDMVPGDRNVTVAIGHGYKAAYGIDCYLKGQEPVDHPKKEIATFESLNTWYYSDAPKTVRPMLDLVRRQSTFDEVQHGLTEENALFEARRCMSCGNCLQCDNCYGVCPDNAVIKTGDDKVPYIFNYDYCKGCGVCSSECPCGAIKMEAESI